MLCFMDYVQKAFAQSTGWNLDNSYASLTTTSQNILDFEVPRSLRLHLSSLASTTFASSYCVGSTGLLDGSISYLYTSNSLEGLKAASDSIRIRDLIPSYRRLQTLNPPPRPYSWEIWHQGKRIDRRDALLYGRLYLPISILEALYMRRLSPTTQLKVSAISGSKLPYGGTILAHVERDTGRHCAELLFSTDSALCGFKALYNFGPEASFDVNGKVSDTPNNCVNEGITATGSVAAESPAIAALPHGRFSAGGEIYYGLLNKSGGLSTGLRFATLPRYTGFPYTMTLTLNPLMGSLSSTYSVLASPLCALSSRFDFNFYSYESDLQIGTELWRANARRSPGDLDWAKKKLGSSTSLASRVNDLGSEGVSGCLKAKLNQQGLISLLWEGRLKALLYSAGVMIDIKGGENLFTGFGLEIHYSP